MIRPFLPPKNSVVSRGNQKTEFSFSPFSNSRRLDTDDTVASYSRKMIVPIVAATLLLTSRTFAFVQSPRNVWLHELEMAVSEHQSISSGCPFSKSFPRYRIDFTPIQQQENESFFSLPLFSKITLATAKSKFLQEHENAIWLEQQDGVNAFASLWRAVSDLTTTATSESTQSVVLAFPDCHTKLLQRFTDILHWLNQEPCVETPVRVDSVVLHDSSTPAIQLNRIGKPSQQVNENSVDPSIVTKRTQAWVKRILVDLSVCPFTKSVTKSGQGLGDLGVPVGRITYDTCNALPNQMYNLMADTWESILKMLQAGPSGTNGVSSILLAAPAFDDDFDLWAGPVFAMLEAGVVAAGAEKEVGVVCFHPRYATPDGKSWPGFGQMHSVPRLQKWLAENDSFHEELTEQEVAAGGAWQRRTPHATINVLRADQLEIAEKRRATGNLYTENISKLVGSDGVGSDQLAADLERERQLTL